MGCFDLRQWGRFDKGPVLTGYSAWLSEGHFPKTLSPLGHPSHFGHRGHLPADYVLQRFQSDDYGLQMVQNNCEPPKVLAVSKMGWVK